MGNLVLKTAVVLSLIGGLGILIFGALETGSTVLISCSDCGISYLYLKIFYGIIFILGLVIVSVAYAAQKNSEKSMAYKVIAILVFSIATSLFLLYGPSMKLPLIFSLISLIGGIVLLMNMNPLNLTMPNPIKRQLTKSLIAPGLSIVGGILILIISGLELFGLKLIGAGFVALIFLPGILLGTVIVISGYMLYKHPDKHKLFGIIILLCSLASILFAGLIWPLVSLIGSVWALSQEILRKARLKHRSDDHQYNR